MTHDEMPCWRLVGVWFPHDVLYGMTHGLTCCHPTVVNHESIELSQRGVEGVPTVFSLCRYGSSFVISVGVSNEVTASWVSDGRVGIKPNSKLPSHARYGV